MAVNNFFYQLWSHFRFRQAPPAGSVEHVSKQQIEYTLPTDIWREIFVFLPRPSVAKCAVVCKAWKVVISEPQLLNKIEINFLRISITQKIMHPENNEKVIAAEFIELATREAVTDSQAALQTIVQLQQFMNSQSFFKMAEIKPIENKILIKMAKIQAKHDPENAKVTLKRLEAANLNLDDETSVNTFVKDISTRQISPERDYALFFNSIWFLSSKAKYQFATGLFIEGQQTFKKLEALINQFDTNSDNLQNWHTQPIYYIKEIVAKMNTFREDSEDVRFASLDLIEKSFTASVFITYRPLEFKKLV